MSRRSSNNNPVADASSSSSRENTTSYSAVADVDDNTDHDMEEIPIALPVPRGRGRRRRYQSVAVNDENESEDDGDTTRIIAEDTHTSSSTPSLSSSSSSSMPTPTLQLTLLDVTHKKFSVMAHPSWTILQLKTAGSRVHKVPSGRQRLIFRGKLLQDEQTLESAQLTTNGLIVHLFPKPRVIVETSHAVGDAASSTCTATSDNLDNNNDNNNTSSSSPQQAHIPTIRIHADDAHRRSQILVLGSPEYMEAQSNVKLFSFMLMMISTIELLNLMAIAMGAPDSSNGGDYSSSGGATPGLGSSFAMGDDVYEGALSPRGSSSFNDYNTLDDVYPNDDDVTASLTAGTSNNSSSSLYGNSTTYNNNSSHPYHNDDPYYYYSQQPWSWVNSCDLILSLLGIYVAILGMRAANETTLKLAKNYLYGTVVVGIFWLLLNYYMTIQVDEAIETEHQEHHPDDDRIPDLTTSEIYQSALSVMVLPCFVWLACCLRAFQFSHLLEEAETEANSRIQAQLLDDNDEEDLEGDMIGGIDMEEGSRVEAGSSSSNIPRHLPAVV